MTKRTVLFHVGLHKTGTSSLQSDFFQPRNRFTQMDGGRGALLPIFVDKFSTELLTTEERSRLDAFVTAAASNDLIPVASHERLSGYPLSGGYDRLSIYRRIASLDHDVKVLFVMREQCSWLYSAWRQMTVDGGSISLKAFLDETSGKAHARLPRPRLEYLNYAREIETLHSMFGRDNVYVVPFEQVARDFAAFKAGLGALVGVDPAVFLDSEMSRRNESRKLSQFYVQGFTNRFLVSSATSPGGLFAEESALGRAIVKAVTAATNALPDLPSAEAKVSREKQRVRERVGDYFAASNRQAADQLQIDLSKYGYRM